MNFEYTGKPRVTRLLKKIYHKIPVRVRFFFVPARFILKLPNQVRLDQWIISGKEILSKENLTVIYSGREKNKDFLIKLAYDNFCKEKYIGKTWIWKISQTVKKKDQHCSLMVTEVHKSLRKFFKAKKCFFIPCWIQGEVDISSDVSKFKSKGFKYHLRKIKKNKLHFEATNDLSQFRNFYYNMYVPYITKRYGNTAVIQDYNFMKEEFSNCDLLLIKKEEECIAGELITYKEKSARLWILGVKDGNYAYVKEGLIGSRYYFSFKYLKEKGHKRVNLGASRAFLKDGALRFKKQWGLNIIDKIDVEFLIKPLNRTDGVKGFFLNNPFIYYSDNKSYNGAIFLENNQPLFKEDLEKIYKDYYVKGMSKLHIFRFEKNDSKKNDFNSKKLSDKIEICSVDDYFE